ncbi:MAG: TIGR03088 family PEP-CTERM/XrtA system glycosyltransferase [Gammaproteobacteria bacterium]|nr:TIGR03088 family PEP-CTERM/XrtA system glycosyltransferase [Gammaproteobacteria bacterium]
MPDGAPPLVLHVIHHLYIGGMENGLVNLINHMPADRYRHAIACVEDYSDFRNRIGRDDVEVIALNRSQTGVWGLRRNLYKLIRRLRPAIVHSRNLSGLDAIAPARLAGVRSCVHGEHGWEVSDLDGTALKPAVLRRMHKAMISHYITVSRDLSRFLQERIGVSEKRITQIYNGVDTERFTSRPRWSVQMPDNFMPAEGLLIGTVGRAQPVKDQATLLRAFAALTAQEDELAARMRLVVVGDGPLLPELRSLATELGIDNQTWFAGAVDHVPEMLAAMDLFVLPSLNEGISNTILEAMACGLPIIATARGGNPELVQPGKTGALFEPGDDAALVSLLRDYLVDDARRRSEGEAARQVACERFSLEAMVRSYAAVYDTLRRS